MRSSFDPQSKIMQTKDSYYKMAAELTKKILIFLADFGDNGFYSCITDANKLDMEPEFTSTHS